MSRPTGPVSKAEALEILESLLPLKLERLVKDVKWAASLGYFARQRPEIRVSGGPTHGDTTGNVMLNHEKTRRRTKELLGEIRGLLHKADEISDGFGSLFEKADHRKDYPRDLIDAEDTRPGKRLVTDDDVRRARQAQQSRTERGEGYGVS